mgnify:CR=1 FL=1
MQYFRPDAELPFGLTHALEAKPLEITLRNLRRLFDLPTPLQTDLWSLTVVTAAALKREFGADKINVGAIGNIVSQLHVHVIARQVGDPGWPAPVWGRSEAPLPVDAVADRLLRMRALVAQIARS